MSWDRKKPYDEYKPGDILCDMHDKFKYLPENLRVVSHIQVQAEGATEIFMKLAQSQYPEPINHPGNKYLMVIAWGTWARNLIAAYSYDDRYFGMVALEELTLESLKRDEIIVTEDGYLFIVAYDKTGRKILTDGDLVFECDKPLNFEWRLAKPGEVQETRKAALKACARFCL